MTRTRDIAAILGVTEASNSSNVALLSTNTSILDSAQVSAIGVTTYDSIGALPLTGLSAGDQAFVESAGAAGTSRLYISNGSGWYNVALINATPRLTLSSEGTITLASDGTPTTITMTALDSDNSSDNLTLSVESGGDLFKFATVSQDSSVVTITPRSEDSATTLGYDGSATLTFKATDGISIASVQNTFTLSFGPDWSAVPTKTKIITGEAASRLYGLGTVVTNIDGTYLGARNHNNGVADYDIWYKSGGSWSKQATLVPTGGSSPAQDYQAAGMSDNGDYVVLGDQAAAKAFVYHRSGTSWTLQQTITCPIANEADFGWSCDISGDGNYIIISDRQSTGADYGGQCWIWKRSGTSWSVEQQLTQPSSSSNYGFSVCIDKTGTYAFVGDWSFNSDAGRGHIWTRSGTTWTLQQTIAGSTTASGDRFGHTSAISGNGEHLAVAAIYDDDGATSSGTVFMFSRSGTTWTQRAAITPAAVATGYTGQRSMGIDDSGENIVLAQFDSLGVGSMYVYSRSGNTWSQARALAGIDGGEQYPGGMTGGRAMSGDGKWIFSGAYNNNDGSTLRAGGVYAFESG